MGHRSNIYVETFRTQPKAHYLFVEGRWGKKGEIRAFWTHKNIFPIQNY